MKKRVILLGLLLLIPWMGANAADWKFMGTNGAGNFFYDAESVRYLPKGICCFVERSDLSKSRREKLSERDKELSSAQFSFDVAEIDCVNQKFRIGYQSFYTTEGAFIKSDPDYSEWNDFDKGSPIGNVAVHFCKPKR